jgi:hypothetical protein
MGCGCKKNKKGKKTTSPSSTLKEKGMQEIIRKKIIEQIQKGNPNPKPSQ